MSQLPVVKEEVLKDYEIAYKSRLASLMGRKEVLSGKAKFGIFGDGKEVAQVAMAKAFKNGDWRAGYYRDQTFMFATGESDVQKFFSQLYADTNVENEPASGGRQMNGHFATRYLDDKGNWLNQMEMKNVAADLSPTAGQMPKLVGLAYASKLYREVDELKKFEGGKKFSRNGDEVVFGTIGNASTSEGPFWEAINAAGVLQIPLAMSVWDDGYGISVPSKYQTTKESISEVLKGFQAEGDAKGFDIYVVKGWDYQALVETYTKAIEKCRKDHSPALIHVIEMTQPQGHSTSGSHERYKDASRLKYEKEYDCISRMKSWMIESKLATEDEISAVENAAETYVEEEKRKAWNLFTSPLLKERDDVVSKLEAIQEEAQNDSLAKQIRELKSLKVPTRRNIQSAMQRSLMFLREFQGELKDAFIEELEDYSESNQKRFSSHLFSETENSPLKVEHVAPIFTDKMDDGRSIINEYFKKQLKKDPRLFLIGEDVGHIGGVNAEFDGLQEIYGEHRVTDAGIREMTIVGQGIGAAMRGLRPVVEVQYLDYLLYAIQTISDDLATLHYRSRGGQIAPCIVRTRGHRLEGIWHTGSPMGVVLSSVRGVHVCVPRNSAQAAGMYNTLFQGDDPAIVIEVLNGFRVKERVPENVGDYTIPLGQVEVLNKGSDVTVVTYGPNIRIAEEAIKVLGDFGISVELIDVQTLLPFDLSSEIAHSIEKTNAVIFFDEDVPGGASAYMMQKVLEDQGAYEFLDSKPRCLTARDHRGAYAADGDYFSKPNAEDLVNMVYEMMHEREPLAFPLYK